MKTLNCLTLLVFFICISLYAQEKGPQISFETSLIDYGTIENGSEGKRSFNFKNTGDQELIIKNVRSSCGCTIPKKPDAPIIPGEKSEIIVLIDKIEETILLEKNIVFNFFV